MFEQRAIGSSSGGNFFVVSRGADGHYMCSAVSRFRSEWFCLRWNGLCVHIYIYIYTHTRVYTHTYIHTYLFCFAERLAQTLNAVRTARKVDGRGRAGQRRTVRDKLRHLARK